MEQFSRQHREPDVCEVVLWRADRDDGHDSGRGNLSTAFSASRPHVEIVDGYSLMVSVSVSCRNAGVVVGLPVAAARGKELIRADLGDENTARVRVTCFLPSTSTSPSQLLKTRRANHRLEMRAGR